MALNGLLIKQLRGHTRTMVKMGKRKEKRNIEVVRLPNRYPSECVI